MKRFVFFLWVSFSVIQALSGQGYVLGGYILHEGSDTPISDIDISILGGDNTQTDSYGKFKLNIPSTFRAGDDIEIVIYDKTWGYHQRTYRMNWDKQQKETIRIKRNANVGVVGTIKDAQTKNFIKGLKVSVSSINLNNKTIQPVVTNEFGIFSISIPKSDFNNFNEYLDLLIQDPSGSYISFQKTVNILAPLELELDKNKSIKTLNEEVGKRKTIILDVNKGNLVKISASGSIEVGRLVGNSTPNGRESGILGISITQYNIVKTFNHAGLMYKLPNDTEWKFCGENCQFNSSVTGKLPVVFEINDNDQGNNSGAYDLIITIEQ